MMSIDWTEQWKLHAPFFRDGFVYVEEGFRLKPGPGFGDLSHPTTRLMLKLMPKNITQTIVDLGCGSGVLSLAAKKRGSPQVYGLDCEDDALNHARENAKLNQLEITFGKTLPATLPECLLLMNMISSEQKIAWQSHPILHNQAKTRIISGIPVEEKEAFLQKASYGSCVREETLEGWMGFIFQA